MSNQNFNWHGDEFQDDVVFPSTQGIAVYTNERDMVVIRQEANLHDDEDAFIILGRQHVEGLILALQRIISAD
jgi:hypothetical protein